MDEQRVREIVREEMKKEAIGLAMAADTQKITKRIVARFPEFFDKSEGTFTYLIVATIVEGVVSELGQLQ